MPNIQTQILSAWEWLSSATVINICISIVLAWLNTNSNISGLAGQFPFCFKTNIHTYWGFSSSEARITVCCFPFVCWTILNLYFVFPILSFLCLLSHSILYHWCQIFSSSAFLFTAVLDFSHASGICLGIAMSVCRSVYNFGPDCNILKSIWWIVIKFCTDIHVSPRVNPNDFAYPLTFPPAPTAGHCFQLSTETFHLPDGLAPNLVQWLWWFSDFYSSAPWG